MQNRLIGFTLVFLVESGNCARVVIQLDCKFPQIDSSNRLNYKWLSQFLPLLLSAAMDATPPPATPPPANPPQSVFRRTSNDLRMLFSEAEQDIITKKGNSQLVKSSMLERSSFLCLGQVSIQNH